MNSFKETMLFLLLVVTATPIAFLLMPIIVILAIAAGILMLIKYRKEDWELSDS